LQAIGRLQKQEGTVRILAVHQFNQRFAERLHARLGRVGIGEAQPSRRGHALRTMAGAASRLFKRLIQRVERGRPGLCCFRCHQSRDAITTSHQINRAPSCVTRAPLPEFRVASTPSLPIATGLLGLLNTLKKSTLNRSATLSFTLTNLKSDASWNHCRTPER